MDTITIQEALARMADAGDKPFKLSFVRSTGKTAGSIKETMAYYGAPNPKDRQAPTLGEQRKKRRTHSETGSVPLTEVSNRQLLTPLISHIIYFQGKKVIH
jgi:hypothetical protein